MQDSLGLSPARPKPKPMPAAVEVDPAEVLVPDSDHSSIETLGSQDNEEQADRIEGPTQNAKTRRSARRKRGFIDVVGGTGRPIKKK